MNIEVVFTIHNTDFNAFQRDVMNRINEIQDKGMVVEIKYNSEHIGKGQVLQSALIIGRCKSETM